MISLEHKNTLPDAYRWYQLVIVISLCLIGSLAFVPLGSVAWLLGVCLFSVFGIPVIIYQLLQIAFTSFVVTDTALTVNTGILIKDSKSIPFSKIQNVDVHAGILMRLFGLARVDLWTASQSQIIVEDKETVATPDERMYLLRDDAQWLKEFIMKADK